MKKAIMGLLLKIVFFPESYMSSRDRPYFDEMIQQLRKINRQESATVRNGRALT